VPVVLGKSESVESPQCVLFRRHLRSRRDDGSRERAVDIRPRPHLTRPVSISAVTGAELIVSFGSRSNGITSAVRESPKTTLKAVFETLTRTVRTRKRARLTQRFAPTVALPGSRPGISRIGVPIGVSVKC
jgi:hypothetical protein